MQSFSGALHQRWRAPRHFWAAGLVSLLLAGLSGLGCRPTQSAADLVIANGTEPETLDPAIATGVSEMRITKALFEGLLRIDGKTGLPIAGLAERWEVTPDGKTYTFYLRTNAAWSTGTSITSEDVVYSWLRALHPSTAGDYAGQLFYIRNAEAYNAGKVQPQQVGIRTRGSYQLEVDLDYPISFFPDLCCYPTLAVVPRQAVESLGDRWLSYRPLPCSGPYFLKEWRLNDRVRIQKNPFYYAAASTHTDTVDLLPVGSPNVALNLYESGVADIIWDKDLIPTELMDLLKRRSDLHNDPFLGTCFYRFNVLRRPFNDVRVRKALALATDRLKLVRKLAVAGERPAFHFVPDGTANYKAPAGLAFDPVAARKLLAEAGYADGQGFPRFAYSFYSAAAGGARMQEKIAVELQQMWQAELGIRMELRQIERKVFFVAQSRLDFEMSASSWVGDYNDANTFLDLFLGNSGNNRTGWTNSAYDGLLRKANAQLDGPARAALLAQAEKILIENDVPIVPLYFYAGFSLYDPERVTGIYPNLLDEHPIQDIAVTRQRLANAEGGNR